SLDIMPTVLECMGNKIAAGGVALGRSLLGGKPTLVEEYGAEAVVAETMRSTLQYEALKRLSGPDSQP
ncbi:MAG: hypothetical protein K2H09_04225, partial [Treponemataceae bacterium]|nr:hypothetical protein [Treponemataceae bacterium]